jgi:mono/diheme cytochrome c family protein
MAHRSSAPETEPEIRFLGYLAEFDTTSKLLAACRQIRQAGYKKTDAYTPFPVHGIDEAMGIKRTKLPFMVLGVGLVACVIGLGLQWYVNGPTEDVWPFPGYTFRISGKPTWSLPANIPVTFEIIVLLSAFATFFGMWTFNKLPQLSNPLFRLDRFKRATSDRFFLMVESNDPIFDETQTREQLEQAGALIVERVDHDMSDAKLPAFIKPLTWCLVCLAFLPPALIYRARGLTNPEPRLHAVPDMDWQDKSKSQTLSPLREVATSTPTFLFADGRVMRPDVEGSVAWGELNTDDRFFRGYEPGSKPPADAAPDANGVKPEPKWLTSFPDEVEVGEALFERGQERYNIYCAVCHGYSGYGDGLVTRRALNLNVQGKAAWTQTKSLHDPAVVDQPIGRLYDTITNGRNSMGPYRAQIPEADRWAIVFYLKALQATNEVRVGGAAAGADATADAAN